MPSSAQGLAERLAQRGGLAGKQVFGALDEHRLAAQSTDCLGHLDAHGATAEGRAALEDPPSCPSPRGWSRRRRARAAPARAARTDRRRSARTTWSAVCRAPSTSTTPVPGEPAAAPQKRDPVVRQPALLTGVGVVGDHEVPPRERGLRRRPRRSPPHCARRARPLPGAAASWTECRPSTSTPRRPARARRSVDAQPTRGQLAGTMLARRAAADDDHVIVGAHVGSPTPARSPTDEPLWPTSVLLISTSVSPLV